MTSSNGLEKRPKLRFPGFDEPYRSTQLGDIAALVNRTDPKSNAPIMMLSAGNGFIMQSEKYSRDNAGQSLKKYILLKQGELAYNHGASKAKQFGCCYELTGPEARIPYVYHCFKINNHEYTPFIAMALNNAKMDKQLKRLVSSSVRMDGLLNISFEDYMSVTIHLPSPSEQKRIADFLQKIDERITAQEKLLASLKKYKRGLLSREFEQQENGNLNNSYVGKLKDYFQLSSGSTPSSTNRTFYSGNIRWVSSGELKSKYLCETSQHISSEAVSSCNLREYPANTLLIAMYGLEAAGVRGTASILSVPATISQACMAIQQTGEIDIEYLYYWYIYNGQWIGIRIAQGTKQQNLSTDTLGSLRIYAPSYSKQKKVCKLLSQIDYLIEKESKKIDLLSSAKRGLLQQLFI